MLSYLYMKTHCSPFTTKLIYAVRTLPLSPSLRMSRNSDEYRLAWLIDVAPEWVMGWPEADRDALMASTALTTLVMLKIDASCVAEVIQEADALKVLEHGHNLSSRRHADRASALFKQLFHHTPEPDIFWHGAIAIG